MFLYIYISAPPNVALLMAVWSLLDGVWGILNGSWGVLAEANVDIDSYYWLFKGAPVEGPVWRMGLLMISVLDDLIYKNRRNYGSVACISHAYRGLVTLESPRQKM